jgi:hypothetical protein
MLIKQVFPESLVSPSTFCKYFYRGEQSVGDVENKAGGALAVKNSGFLDAALWATPGYMAVGGGTGNYCTVVPATHDATLNGYTLVVTARIKKAAAAFPAAEQYIISSYDPGVNQGGIVISCRTDGQARCYLNTTDNTTINANTAAGALTNGTTANERSLVFFFPRESGSAWAMIDALDGNSSAASTVAGKSLAGNRNMRIGLGQAGVANDAYLVAAFAAYQVPADLSSIDRKSVGDWALRNPGQPIPDWVFA